MNINNAFPSRWLKSGDLPDDQDLPLTIQSVEVQTVGQGEDAEDKPVVAFRETDKGLVLNKTNASTIAALYGPETDGWIGKQITLYSTEVQFGSKMTVALRVRTKAPKATVTKATNGNGSPRARLLNRLAELEKQAEELEIDFNTIDITMATDADVIKAGKELAARIAATQAAF